MKFTRYYIFSFILAASQVSHAGNPLNGLGNAAAAPFAWMIIAIYRAYQAALGQNQQPQAAGGGAAAAQPTLAERAAAAAIARQEAAQRDPQNLIGIEAYERNLLEQEAQTEYEQLRVHHINFLRLTRLEEQMRVAEEERQRQITAEAQQRRQEAMQNLMNREAAYRTQLESDESLQRQLVTNTEKATRQCVRNTPSNQQEAGGGAAAAAQQEPQINEQEAVRQLLARIEAAHTAIQHHAPQRDMAPVYLHNLYLIRNQLVRNTAQNLLHLEDVNTLIIRAENPANFQAMDALMFQVSRNNRVFSEKFRHLDHQYLNGNFEKLTQVQIVAYLNYWYEQCKAKPKD